MSDALLRFSHADAGWGIIARKRVWAITNGRLPTVEDYHAALVQCLKDKAAEIERLRLTDAERQAITWAANAMRPECRATLQGLLSRSGKIDEETQAEAAG